MQRKALALYLANWYAWAVSGILMALQHPAGSWLADLPWASWGTELGRTLTEGEAASGGAWWLLMGTLLALGGIVGSLVVSLLWLAARDEAGASGTSRPGQLMSRPQETQEAAFTDRAQEAAGLVEDPRLRSLIQQLNTRLG